MKKEKSITVTESKNKSKTIVIEGWLARSELFGYEIYSDKPEPMYDEGKIFQWKILGGFTKGRPSFYAHLSEAYVPAELYLPAEKTRPIKLEIVISEREMNVKSIEAVKPR